MAHIVLVRHAQSEWNALGRWQGWADPPLTELGRSQAELAGVRLSSLAHGHRQGPPPRLVVSSDLQRASTTASIVADRALPHATPRTDPDWREYRVGAWSGLTRAEIEHQWPGELDRWDRGDLLAPPGGEHRAHFEARLVKALGRVAADTGETGAALVVSHGGAIRSLSRRFRTPVDHIGNLAGVVLTGSAGRFRQVDTIDLLGGSDLPAAD
ncbi:MAG: histidine phosphatase family protein [Actinomycetota bacterium]|nr:histidine phosphatase family protein [Actinomycetota bacterium]